MLLDGPYVHTLLDHCRESYNWLLQVCGIKFEYEHLIHNMLTSRHFDDISLKLSCSVHGLNTCICCILL